jgi:hypothetical protein
LPKDGAEHGEHLIVGFLRLPGNVGGYEHGHVRYLQSDGFTSDDTP